MSDMRDAIVVLLAGGQGERLWPLTRDRAKPAVPFGALYRIIDITLSNCINSNLRRIFILTQYKALSLNRHVRAGWSPLAGLGDYIEVLPPQMRVSQQWYQGTADAVYQHIYSIGSEEPKYVIILSGDHIYKMNYSRMLKQHGDSGAEVTVATIEIPAPQAAKQFGVIETDKDWRIIGFEEKPAVPKESPHHPGHCNASMGIYIFNTHLLIPILLADSEDPKSSHDFGKDILPRIISKHRVFAYNFVDENAKDALYWRDVGTLDAYYEANMTSSACLRSSIFMTSTGRFVPGSTSIRRPSLSLPIPSAWASLSIPSSPEAPSSPAAAFRNPSSATTSASTVTAMSQNPSSTTT